MKVLFVAKVSKLHIKLFHIPFLKMFKDNGWETAVAARDDHNEGEDNTIQYCDTFYDVPFERSPFNLSNIRAYKQLKEIIDKGDYDIIHCHTPVPSILTRIAARKARKKGCKVIYTAHGFFFYKGAPLINWLLYFPAEWIASFFTDILITINREDYKFAKQHLHAKQIEYVPGVGVDLSKYKKSEEIRKQTRNELGLNEDEKMILSVGELSSRKNHQLVINALFELNDLNWKYYIVGQGELKNQLELLIESKGLSNRIILLGFREDINALLNAADLFVFPSKQEGLPVALMEAIACRVPVVCTKIRGNTDLVSQDCLFELENINELKTITDIALRRNDTDSIDSNLQNLSNYSFENISRCMERIYFGEQYS